MITKAIRTFWTEDRAAISPLYAVGILALVGVSGVGFDYGRLMALDSELQNAADQAALAAATQLDGNDDAMIRSRDAANNALATSTSPFVNETRFANDKRQLPTGTTDTRPIVSLGYRFFEGYDDDTMGAEVTSDANGADAAVVEVTVNSRRAFYALTPVVGAVASGPVIGRALAGLESATCDVAPMFFCLPHDGADDPISDFPRTEDAGRELKLHLRNNQSETFTPGNFGFLDVGWNSSPPNRELGLNVGPLGCFRSSPDVETSPGSRTPQASALNTRFDLFGPPVNVNDCDDSNGDFCPSENVTKDWVNVQRKNKNAAPTCDATPPNSSTWSRYSAVSDTTLTNPGYPDDSAFVGILGNGVWNPTNWLTSNHPSSALADIPDDNGDGNISRYEAFLWELTDPANLLQPRAVGQSPVQGNFYNLYCVYPTPVQADPWPSSTTQKDRRILTVAAVDCSVDPPNGSADVRIKRWVDLFLVRPIDGASETQYLAEVIGPAKKANGDSGFQYFGRKKAVLIR